MDGSGERRRSADSGISISCMRQLNRYSGGADFIFIPERPPKVMPWEDGMCAEIHRVSFPSTPSLVRPLHNFFLCLVAPRNGQTKNHRHSR